MGNVSRSTTRPKAQLVKQAIHSLKKEKSFLSLFFTHLRVFFFRLIEEFRVFFLYYRKGKYLLLDLILKSLYLFSSPHRINKTYWMRKKSLAANPYGETPLTTMDRIARHCRLLSKDVVYDLGCGSGRAAFWLQQFVGCQVVGVDCIPAFIQKASEVKKFFGLNTIQFRCEDLLDTRLHGATAIFLYWTTWPDLVVREIVHKCALLPQGTKFITVSFPLEEGNSACFRLEKVFKARFHWGKADVYLQTKR